MRRTSSMVRGFPWVEWPDGIPARRCLQAPPRASESVGAKTSLARYVPKRPASSCPGRAPLRPGRAASRPRRHRFVGWAHRPGGSSASDSRSAGRCRHASSTVSRIPGEGHQLDLGPVAKRSGLPASWPPGFASAAWIIRSPSMGNRRRGRPEAGEGPSGWHEGTPHAFTPTRRDGAMRAVRRLDSTGGGARLGPRRAERGRGQLPAGTLSCPRGRGGPGSSRLRLPTDGHTPQHVQLRLLGARAHGADSGRAEDSRCDSTRGRTHRR